MMHQKLPLTDMRTQPTSVYVVLSEQEDHYDAPPPPKHIPASKICLSAISMLAVLRLFDYCFHNQVCNLIFRCNCTWPWAGGWVNCNVHNTTGPRCPWCLARQHLVWSVDPAFVCTLAWAGFGFFGMRYLKSRTPRALVLVLVMPFVIWCLYSLFIGLMFYWGTDYPWFLMFHKKRN
jgi:hypothetical protein